MLEKLSECKSCEDAIAYVWRLNYLDKKILFSICITPMDVYSLAKKLHKTTGRVQQRLDYLISLGIASRKKHCLNRGYKFVYSSIEKKELKKISVEKLRKLVSKLEQLLEEK